MLHQLPVNPARRGEQPAVGMSHVSMTSLAPNRTPVSGPRFPLLSSARACAIWIKAALNTSRMSANHSSRTDRSGVSRRKPLTGANAGLEYA